MFSMFSSFFAMIASLFASGQTLGRALNNYAISVEEHSLVHLDVARVERDAKLAALNKVSGTKTLKSIGAV